MSVAPFRRHLSRNRLHFPASFEAHTVRSRTKRSVVMYESSRRFIKEMTGYAAFLGEGAHLSKTAV